MNKKDVLLVAIVLATSLPISQAANITFAATDLVDITAGEDLWRYDYTVSGRGFLQSEFFDIYFSPALYRSLIASPAPNADWDVLVLQQPDPTILQPFDRGIFDAFAVIDGPSLSGTFSVSFIYLGAGNPGAQPFEIYDPSSILAESGFTSAPANVIPEPSTGALFLIALAAGATLFHRRSSLRR